MNVKGTRVERGQRLAAWCCLAAIATLSLLPAASVAPVRTSMGGHLEHLLTYVVTTLITVLAYVDHSRFKITQALILYAAGLEYLQRYVPGRLSSLEDFAFSATGIMLGVAAFHIVRNFRVRHANHPSRFANGECNQVPDTSKRKFVRSRASVGCTL